MRALEDGFTRFDAPPRVSNYTTAQAFRNLGSDRRSAVEVRIRTRRVLLDS
jgi:hypothetical protein